MALDHRLALRLGGRQVVAARDRLRLRDLPRRVVDNNLRKSRPLLRVDRQLQLAVLHLILRRNWRPGCCTGRESGLQRDLRRAERFGEFGVTPVPPPLCPSPFASKKKPKSTPHPPKRSTPRRSR